MVAVSEVRTETLVLLCVPDQKRGSTGDREPLSHEPQALNHENSQDWHQATPPCASEKCCRNGLFFSQ